MFDAIKDAIERNKEQRMDGPSQTQGGGGPSEPQVSGGNYEGVNSDIKDTTRLADFFSQYKGKYLRNTGITFPHTSPSNLDPVTREYTRICAHVRTDNQSFFAMRPNNTPINQNLINAIYKLDKNYND